MTAAGTTCKVDGCGREVRARGWCRRHYESWKRHGDPLKAKENTRRAAEMAHTRETVESPCANPACTRTVVSYVDKPNQRTFCSPECKAAMKAVRWRENTQWRRWG
jgi:hypothetical protein